MEKPSFPASQASPVSSVSSVSQASQQSTGQTIWSQHTLLFMLIGVAAGLLVGALTALGQSVLRGNLFQLTNSGAIWVIVTFFMGRYASTRKIALVAGTLALFGEFLGYYGTVWLISPYVSPLWRIIAWCVVGLVAGPILAWGGYISSHVSGRLRLVGVGMLGAIFIGEGVYLIAWVTTPIIPVVWLVIGVAITALLTRREIQRTQAWAYTAGLSIFFYGAIETLTLLNQLRLAHTAG